MRCVRFVLAVTLGLLDVDYCWWYVYVVRFVSYLYSFITYNSIGIFYLLILFFTIKSGF